MTTDQRSEYECIQKLIALYLSTKDATVLDELHKLQQDYCKKWSLPVIEE